MSENTEWIGEQPGGMSLMDGNGVIHIMADERWMPTKLTADPKLVDMVRQSGVKPHVWSIYGLPLYLFEDSRLPYEYIAFPAPPPPVPKINGLAKTARVFGFLSILFIPCALIALVCGYAALGQIRDRGERGREEAMTGIIIGWIIAGLFIVLLILIASH